MRLLGRHPRLDAATADGAMTVSWAKEIAGWTGRIDHGELQAQADRILVEAAAAGSGPGRPEDPRAGRLRGLARAEPDPDEDPRGRGFGDRYLRLDTTMDGAGRVGGDLTPECAAAVTAVLEALGEEPRPGGHAHHRAAVPRRPPGGLRAAHPRQDGPRPAVRTRVDVIIPLSDLLDLDGASVIEDAWLPARAGEHGYLSGKRRGDRVRRPHRPGRDRQPRLGAVSEMITLVADAYNHAGAKQGTPLPPGAWEALQYALARLAISSSPAPAPSPPPCAAASSAPPSTGKASSSTSATPTPSPNRSAGPSRPRQGLRLARRLRPPPRRLRRPPRQAQETRREDQHHRLRDAVPVSS